MGIDFGCLLPHPPVIIPEIGGDEASFVSRTRTAMERVAEEIAAIDPDCLVLISPHSIAFSDAFAIQGSARLTCQFYYPGAQYIRIPLENDLELAEAIEKETLSLGLTAALLDARYPAFCREDLDHGVGVPLYFISQKVQKPIVSLGISDFSLKQHYSLGIAVQRAAERLGRKVVFVASGDLSHALSPGAPAPYAEEGAEFDALIERLLNEANFAELVSTDRRFAEKAAECGLRSIATLAGAFNGFSVETKVLSHEGPFGVGYMVATVRRGTSDDDRDLASHLRHSEVGFGAGQGTDPYTNLAKTALESYLASGSVPEPPDGLPKELLNSRAGCFVCLKRRGGELRGCIGTLEPTQANLAVEIISNVIQAATADPRFPSVDRSELPYLTFSVDVLEPSESVNGLNELDPSIYGVIVKRGYQVGVLLPRLEGVDTVEKQVAIAKQKAGISPRQEAELFRFRVRRYEEA